MNGPTICFPAAGSARRTEKPPRSRARGTITCSMASHERGLPGTGSLSGCQLIDSTYRARFARPASCLYDSSDLDLHAGQPAAQDPKQANQRVSEMPGSLEGKVAVVTGVSHAGQVGQAVARDLASKGAFLTICARKPADA